MVRTAIACGWCRRSKIKCIHQGEPPCRNCLRNGRTSQGECTLSMPESVMKKRQRTSERSHNPSRVESAVSGETINVEESVLARSNASLARVDEVGRKNIWTTTSRTEIVQAASSFCRKFPELNFLHIGTFDIDSQEPTTLLLKAALLALYCTVDQQNKYISYVKNGLSGILFEQPWVETVQALLMLAMYEWGYGRTYSAWMTTGTAIRMIQSIEHVRGKENPSQLEQEIYNRTFWGCFVMDRLVLCGKSQPFTLPLEQMRIQLPIGDQDFAFGQISTPRVSIGNFQEGDHTSIDHNYSILVRGFDIWARILKWFINGGRTQPGMTLLANCPWMTSSPWKNFFDELNLWRQTQGARMKYPGVKASGHVSLNHGEQFAYINLIYYVSILFLNREYIPFLPTADTVPRGPVDPPLLQATAPEGWWAERAAQLFDAARQITLLLQELDDLNAPLITPFAGFCEFSAATMNTYVSNFPNMNHGKSQGSAEELLEINIRWQARFKETWPMGIGWFKTMIHTRDLYTKASKDRQRFQGKTRADFEALDSAIHDASGASLIENEDVTATGANQNSFDQTERHEAEAIHGLQLPAYPQVVLQPSMTSMEPAIPDNLWILNQWNQWPLWGEQQTGRFATGGFQFDFDVQYGVMDP